MHHHRSAHVHEGETGASLIEYALLLALISVVCLSALAFFGTSNEGSFADSACKVGNAREAATAC